VVCNNGFDVSTSGDIHTYNTQMALWTGNFTEDAYGSNLDYRINENGEFIATYKVPIGSSSTERGPEGNATLRGVVDVLEGDVIRIEGYWKHHTKNTPFYHLNEGGRFEMLSKKGMDRKCLGRMEGHWSILDDETKHPWVWNLGSTEKIGRFTQRLVKSVHMDRFGMACGWLFFVQTLIQLISFIEEWTCNTDMNLAFNIDYSILYFVFLLVYWEMDANRPRWAYILGILFYFVGYMLFASLYGKVGDAKVLYRGGSWFFLIGSLLLMYATALTRIHEYNPFSKSSALFWGATCFFFGSLCFAMDADSSGFGARENGIVGYVLFTFGRIFFIRGSQTPRCDVLFMKKQAAVR
jgi:hypothetical protein